MSGGINSACGRTFDMCFLEQYYDEPDVCESRAAYDRQVPM